MKRLVWLAILIAAAGFAIWLRSPGGRAWMTAQFGAVTVKYDLVSPDGKYMAALYERRKAGDLPEHSVAMRSVGEEFSTASGRVFAAKGDGEVSVRWVTAERLLVTYSQVEPSRTERIWRLVAIDYNDSVGY